MKIYIVIPAHNEEAFISQTLQSLVEQTFQAHRIVVVDDHSTDQTASIVEKFCSNYPFISLVKNQSDPQHLPGAKVVQAFYRGYESLDDQYDIICKFDADLIFPKNYLETLVQIFQENPRCGMAGGLLYVQHNGKWVYEKIADPYHLRGPIKSYLKPCFESIGGLKTAIGWDTADVLLAQYHGFQVCVSTNLIVKHLKPTGKSYHSQSRYEQGKALYQLRYSTLLTLLTALKMAINKKHFPTFFDYISGFRLAKKKRLPYIVSPKEGKFIRNFRWQKIWRKLKI